MDAGTADAPVVDASEVDTGKADAGETDGSGSDGSVGDAGADASKMDAGSSGGSDAGEAGPGTDAATSDACIPLSCTGYCGQLSDGCGHTLNCFGCPVGQSCGASTPNKCVCTGSFGCDGVCNSGVVVDVCGVCGGDGTECAGCPIPPPTPLVVNSLTDGPSTPSVVTLRGALQAAMPGDTVSFATSLFATGPQSIVLTAGALVISTDVTISGPGASLLTVDGNHASQVLSIGDVNASISGITIANGTSGTSGGNITAAIDPSKTLDLTNVVVTGGNAAFGGGIKVTGDGTMNVTNSTFSNNSAATGNGGAIDSPGVFLTISGCTFLDNLAGNGGAVSVGNDGVTIVNSTMAHNQALGAGGAVYSDFNAIYDLVNCTLSGNAAGSGGGGISILGGGMTLENTIVAGNTSSASAPDVNGLVNSLGYNLVGDTTGSVGFVATDVTNVPANLGPLLNNGGPTLTMAPLPASPAMQSGTASGAPTTDQRGIARPQGANPNIGAVEGVGLVVTNNADSGPGSLRQAVSDANTIAPLYASIAFDWPISNNIQLTSGALVIDAGTNVRIVGPGATRLGLDANGFTNNTRAFVVSAGSTVAISGMTIVHGQGLTGGAISSAGTLTLTDDWFDNNDASQGGGALYVTSGTVVVDRCAFSHSSSVVGGAIESDGANLTVTNTTLFANAATNNGGAIFASASPGQVVLTNCTLSGNSAMNSGGGLFGPAITLSNTIVAGNTSPNGPDGSGTFTSGGHNIVGTSVGLTLTGGTLDKLNVDPMLGPFQSNGGPTPTMALPTGSIAIDNGESSGAPTVDQRGIPRPQGAEFDIGAVESPYSHCP